MKTLPKMLAALLLAGLSAWPVGAASASDWPQFMRGAAHTGDAADEELKLPLGLVAQVKLDDMVLTSPAVVGGLAYVVDQMGTAYCVDPKAGRIVWKAAPDGEKAMGSNTSSPCVAKGRMYYGTTAGNFHLLDCRDGKVVRTIPVGWPITGSPTLANERIYFQALDPIVRCLDLDGNEKWKWDHYARWSETPEAAKAQAAKRLNYPDGYDRQHYGGNDVAVSGRSVVATIGWDLLCLEDAGTEAKLVWCNRATLGRDPGAPRAAAISGEKVYATYAGGDGCGGLLQVSLKDGSCDVDDARARRQPSRDLHGAGCLVLGTPALRGQTACYGTHKGVTAHDFGAGKNLWFSFEDSGNGGGTWAPVLSSPALSKGHCALTSSAGELVVVDLAAHGSGPRLAPAPFRFKAPHGKVISSSPAISDGMVCFGCDDGFFYALGAGGAAQPRVEAINLHQPKSRMASASGKNYTWPTTYGNMANTRYADDPGLKPPFKMRWAVQSFGTYRSAPSCSERDLVLMSMDAGTVACLEQMTGRLRWRVQVPPDNYYPGDAHGVLCADGRIYVPRQGNSRNRLSCLDAETGQTLWGADLGGCGKEKSWSSPVIADGRVAFGSIKGSPAREVVEAWDAESGKPAWQVELQVKTDSSLAPVGCASGGVMYFTAGGSTGYRPEAFVPGETVAIEAKTGNMLWRTAEAYTTLYPAVMFQNDRLYVMSWGPAALTCLDAKTGKLAWKAGLGGELQHGVALGPEVIAVKGYGGGGTLLDIKDGHKLAAKCGDGGAFTCSPVVLTASGLSIVATVGGICARDLKTGEPLWQSKGFAPRSCGSPAAANGRMFLAPQSSGRIYCFEPEGAK